MAKFRNISGRDFSILINGRRVLIPAGSIMEGSESFKNYKALREVTDNEYANHVDHMPNYLKANPMSKLRSFINPNSNSSEYTLRVTDYQVIESNLHGVNEAREYICKYAAHGLPNVVVCVYGNNNKDFIEKSTKLCTYKNVTFLQNTKEEDLPNISSGIVIKVNSEVFFDFDYITFIAKRANNNKVILPKPFTLNELNINYVTAELHKYKVKKEVDLTISTLVHNLRQYTDFLEDLSKQKTKFTFEVISIPNFNNEFTCCAEPLNIALELADGKIVNLCHQDLRSNTAWIEGIMNHVDILNAGKEKWGVLGMAGAFKYSIASTPESEGNILFLSDTTSSRQTFASIYRQVYGKRKEVQVIDELALIMQKNSPFRFDADTFNQYHWYGADICLQALSMGYKNYAIDADCLHLSNGQDNLSGGHASIFIEQGIKLFKKWSNTFPYFKTTTATFMSKERLFIPAIFMIINHKNGNKNLPELIKVS